MAVKFSLCLVALVILQANVSASIPGCPADLQLEDPTEDDLRVHAGLCYHFVMSRVRSYVDAARTCKYHGGILATVKSQSVSDFLLNYLTNERPGGWDTPVWIGLNDRNNEGSFVWEDGSPLDSNEFTNWARSHNHDHTTEDCIGIDPEHRALWKDYKCSCVFCDDDDFDILHAYVCQFGVPTTTTQPTTTAAPTVAPTTAIPTAAPTTAVPTAAPTTAVPTSAPAATTTLQSILQGGTSTTTMPGFNCPPFVCNFDCGLDGYKTDGNGCSICVCDS